MQGHAKTTAMGINTTQHTIADMKQINRKAMCASCQDTSVMV
jgi:hypothetical protein